MAEDNWNIPDDWKWLTHQGHEQVYADGVGGIWFVSMNTQTGNLYPRAGNRSDRRRFIKLEKSK